MKVRPAAARVIPHLRATPAGAELNNWHAELTALINDKVAKAPSINDARRHGDPREKSRGAGIRTRDLSVPKA